MLFILFLFLRMPFRRLQFWFPYIVSHIHFVLHLGGWVDFVRHDWTFRWNPSKFSFIHAILLANHLYSAILWSMNIILIGFPLLQLSLGWFPLWTVRFNAVLILFCLSFLTFNAVLMLSYFISVLENFVLYLPPEDFNFNLLSHFILHLDKWTS